MPQDSTKTGGDLPCLIGPNVVVGYRGVVENALAAELASGFAVLERAGRQIGGKT